MKAQKDCFECLKNQASVHQVDLQKYCTFLDAIPKDPAGASLSLTPPQIAISLYREIAKDLGQKDPFREIKKQSILKAYEIIKNLKEELSLQEAIKISALGNVIDYGSASAFCIHHFDFARELKKLDFACFDFESFAKLLARSKNLVMLGDNAGENLFDEVLLQAIKREYPKLKLYYFVRGKPIINDLTLQDLQDNQECQGIFEICDVVDSGVKSPGFIYEDATPKAQRIFSCADVILSKGMGNFECLNEMGDLRIFYLLKIKCQVVANCLGFPLGKMVFKQNQSFL